MDTPHWPLTILSKAVHYKNLTGASSHVGLSQPQLSRLISQLESEFKVVLLDRSAKRKSGWTPAAYRLAEIYTSSSRKLVSSIQEALVAQIPTQIKIGTLEGLRDIALEVVHTMLEKSDVVEIELDVYDQNDLEQKFFNSDLDIIFSSRIPGKQKFKNAIEMGYQSLDKVETNTKFTVLSPYEYGRLKKKPENKTIISNSLSVRKLWLENYGGQGTLPSSVKTVRGKDLMPVLVIASEIFNETLWQVIEKSTKR
jgi:LysR family transcriptional regulator, transcriptional activator for aaeXAB operon